MHFDPNARFFVLSNRHKINFEKFSTVIFICFTPFSKLQFGLIGSMILMNDDFDDFDVSLKTAAMKIGNIFTVFIATIAKGKKCFIG